MLKLLSTSGGCLVMLCVCFSLISLSSCGEQWRFTFTTHDDDYDPPGSTCENAGVSYPGNPFSGWPQQNRGWDDVTYYYCAEDYYQEFGRTHWGIDIAAYHREPVYATATATVVWAYQDAGYGMGKTVKLCNGGWCATYMHLDEWVVAAGQSVARGQVLGYADNTGFSTGTHLHYQINHPDGYAVDPAPTMGAAVTAATGGGG